MPPRRPRRPFRNDYGDEIPDPRKGSLSGRVTPEQRLDYEVERRNRWRTGAQGKLTREQVAKELEDERKENARRRREVDPHGEVSAMPSAYASWPATYASAMATADAAGMNDQERRTFLTDIQHSFIYSHSNMQREASRLERVVRYQYGYGYQFDWPAWREDYKTAG